MQLIPGGAGFVTGGASGIGLATARALAEAGLKVVIADVDAARVEAAATELGREGAEVLPLALDVRDEAAWAVAAARAWAWADGVQVLCNCAGVVFMSPFLEESPDIWRLTHAVNVDGPYFGARAFLPKMLARGEPARIVNVASLAGLWGEYKLASYTASKFALVGLSEALQLELARTPVGVSVVFPGPTRTSLGTSTRALAEEAGVVAKSPAAAAAATAREPRGMDPAFVGRRIVEGVRKGEFYIIPHPGWRPLLEARFKALTDAFGAPADPDYTEAAGVPEKIAEKLRQAFTPEG